MKLHLLEALIRQFMEAQTSSRIADWYYPHEMVGNFHAHWSLKTGTGLTEMYDDCLSSEISQRWWKRDHYRPKEIMLKLIASNAELARIAFHDLANENSSLEGRLSRFGMYADDLLQEYRQKNIRDIESHHHQDASIVSLYLAGMYPDAYSLYPGLNVFRSFAKAVGSPDIPQIDDLVRYQKMTSVVQKFLQRDPAYDKFTRQRSGEFHKIKFLPRQTAYEVFIFAGESHPV